MEDFERFINENFILIIGDNLNFKIKNLKSGCYNIKIKGIFVFLSSTEKRQHTIEKRFYYTDIIRLIEKNKNVGFKDLKNNVIFEQLNPVKQNTKISKYKLTNKEKYDFYY